MGWGDAKSTISFHKEKTPRRARSARRGKILQTKTKRLKKEITPRDLSHWERTGGKNMKVTGNRKREGHRSISLHSNILPLRPILSCFSVCHATGTSRDEGTKANILSLNMDTWRASTCIKDLTGQSVPQSSSCQPPPKGAKRGPGGHRASPATA